MDEDATLMGKTNDHHGNPMRSLPSPPCATDTHTAHSGVMFNPTKLLSQIEIQTLKKKKKSASQGKKTTSPKYLVGLSYINIKITTPHSLCKR